MNAKQLRFCEEYVIDLNATQAYIRAGYSKEGASVSASKLLGNPKIGHKITELQEKIREKSAITAEMVVNELVKLGFTNFKNYIGAGNTIKDVSELDDSVSAAVESLTTTTTEWEGGSKTQVKIKLASKADALEKLGRHLGIFERDNDQKKGTITVEIE